MQIADSRTLIMRDQPQAFADAIRAFIAQTGGPRPTGAAEPSREHGPG